MNIWLPKQTNASLQRLPKNGKSFIQLQLTPFSFHVVSKTVHLFLQSNTMQQSCSVQEVSTPMQEAGSFGWKPGFHPRSAADSICDCAQEVTQQTSMVKLHPSLVLHNKMQLQVSQMRLHWSNALQYLLMQLHERLQKLYLRASKAILNYPPALHQRTPLCSMSRSTSWSGKPLACCHNSTREEIKHKAEFTNTEQEKTKHLLLLTNR